MADDETQKLWAIANDQPEFAQLMGIKILDATPDYLEAEVLISKQLGNRNGVLHGGAVMGIADNIGGTASFLNLKPGQSTTTIESKTNFFRSVAIGEKLTARCEPLHKGRKTLVWQTTLRRADGKVAAITIQTQMILKAGDR